MRTWSRASRPDCLTNLRLAEKTDGIFLLVFFWRRNLNLNRESFLRVLFRARFRTLLLGALIAMCLPSVSEAKDSCPWINEATASGALDGAVTSTVARPAT